MTTVRFMKATLLALTLSCQFVFAADLLNYETVVDLADHKGTPFFEVMRKEIKPKLDDYATEGFVVTDGKTVAQVLKNVSFKVSKGALKGTTQAGLEKVANTLNKTQKKITFYDLPAALVATEGFKGDKYDLTTFLALASGGGVAVKMNDEIYAYNVNYGTGKIEKDEMTGRSFGAAGTYHKADDASDAAYLKALQKIAKPEKADKGKDITAFTRGVLETVILSDTTNYKKMSNAAKAVISDFVAVYTAEQDRHLMANLESHHWDSALLEVTLLANFHAGQKKFQLYFESPENVFTFTDSVPDQNAARKEGYAGELRQAGMVDYWQFSKNPKNPNRSGINITRRAFTKLEYKICDYERANHPELVKAVEDLLKGVKVGGNLFDSVSDFLISFKTQKDVAKVGPELVEAYLAFLVQVRKDAEKITNEIAKTNDSSINNLMIDSQKID